MLPPPPRSTLFPYTTLFRSSVGVPDRRLRSRGRRDPRRQTARLSRQHQLHLVQQRGSRAGGVVLRQGGRPREDRKSTRLNSSHTVISYAVFCLKKKKKKKHR